VHLFWGENGTCLRTTTTATKTSREALLDHIDVPRPNVHAMPASDGEFGDDIDAAALFYEQVLAATAADGAQHRISTCTFSAWARGPRDSLFPHTPAVKETSRLVVGVTDSPSRRRAASP